MYLVFSETGSKKLALFAIVEWSATSFGTKAAKALQLVIDAANEDEEVGGWDFHSSCPNVNSSDLTIQ